MLIPTRPRGGFDARSGPGTACIERLSLQVDPKGRQFFCKDMKLSVAVLPTVYVPAAIFAIPRIEVEPVCRLKRRSQPQHTIPVAIQQSPRAGTSSAAGLSNHAFTSRSGTNRRKRRFILQDVGAFANYGDDLPCPITSISHPSDDEVRVRRVGSYTRYSVPGLGS
jgi:hypothetical protein